MFEVRIENILMVQEGEEGVKLLSDLDDDLHLSPLLADERSGLLYDGVKLVG